MMMVQKWLKWFALLQTVKSAWLAEVKRHTEAKKRCDFGRVPFREKKFDMAMLALLGGWCCIFTRKSVSGLLESNPVTATLCK